MEFKSVLIINEQDQLNEETFNHLKNLKISYKFIDTLDLDGCLDQENVLYVVHDFEGQTFAKLLSLDKPMMGFQAFNNHLANNLSFQSYKRPIFNTSMKDVVAVIADMYVKEEAYKVYDRFKYMGGRTRDKIEYSSSVTHLICKNTKGRKYRTAINFGKPIMNIDWIDYAWSKRFEEDFDPLSDEMVKMFTVPPFAGLKLAFFNFSEKDLPEYIDLTQKNGGEVSSFNDSSCTHVVIDAIPEDPRVTIPISDSEIRNIHVVYKEWFWDSIQTAGRSDESLLEHSYGYPCAKNTQRKLRTSSISNRNSIIEVFSPDFFPHSCDSPQLKEILENSIPSDLSKLSKRHRISIELLQTEKNYLDILCAIVNIFKLPLQEYSAKDELLDATEVRIIFGNLQPIIEIHQKIYKELETLIINWKENCPIGEVFLKHSNSMLKAYSSFINYYENTQKTLASCDSNYPRFHAFLKRAQSKKECGRQELKDLLARPVQRIPSVRLLLNELIKNTPEKSSDHVNLKLAHEKLDNVLTNINEDKRKVEGQLAMFDIVNDIEDCPATLLSSTRSFICKADVKLLIKDDEGNITTFKPYTMIIFLFNDALEICKKRSVKRTKSWPKEQTGVQPISTAKTWKKSYRHVELISLDYIKEFTVFENYHEFENVFSLQTKICDGRTFMSYPFSFSDKEITLELFIQKFKENMDQPVRIHQNMAKNLNCLDFSNAQRLADILGQSGGFQKTKQRLSRAFSFRRPSLMNVNSMPMNPFYTPPPEFHESRESLFFSGSKTLKVKKRKINF